MQFSKFLHHHEPGNILKNFIFGVEDSLVSTVGLLAGVATASADRSSIITTGIVLIVVEAFSMGIGSFLTEETSEEMTGQQPDIVTAVKGAFTMLTSYIVAGLIPLLPYTVLPAQTAMTHSVIYSLIGLFLLGYGTARAYARPDPWKRALKMLILGGIAVGLGVIIGKIFHL